MPGDLPLLLGTGDCLPPRRYTQMELLERFKPQDPRVVGFFRDGHIEARHLYLPEPGPDGEVPDEPQGVLLEKHLAGAREIGVPAAHRALEAAGVEPQQVDQVVCVTSTGFLTPGLSARLLPELGLRRNVHRQDVVGMGCNAGLNGLQVTTWQAQANPNSISLLLCIEVCSAAYVLDGSLNGAVVNSLFGDGAAAVVVGTRPIRSRFPNPAVLGFASQVIPEAMEAMRFQWDEDRSRFSFFLDRDVPYVVGAWVEKPVSALLSRHHLRLRDIDHWIVHSGGRKVIDSIKYNLGLTDHDVRHTHSVLRDCGNLSSASFLFSYRRLVEEGGVEPGDRGVMLTMGPGSTIETALLQW